MSDHHHHDCSPSGGNEGDLQKKPAPPSPPPSLCSRQAYVTLMTSDNFLMGVTALLHSLARVGCIRRSVIVLVTSTVSRHTRFRIVRDAPLELRERTQVRVVDPIGFGGYQNRIQKEKKEREVTERKDTVEDEGGCKSGMKKKKKKKAERRPGGYGHSVAHVQSWVEVAYTKLRVWGLTEFEKIVYLDADTLVLQPIQELFDIPVLPEGLPAAAPDIFPPDKFNAGVLVLAPSQKTLTAMIKARGGSGRGGKAEEEQEQGDEEEKEEEEEEGFTAGDEEGKKKRMKEEDKKKRAEKRLLYSYDGGDTGFLNAFFPQWFSAAPHFRLPFRYNAQRTLYWYTARRNPGYWNVIRPIKIVHFSSSPKPWETKSFVGDKKRGKGGEGEGAKREGGGGGGGTEEDGNAVVEDAARGGDDASVAGELHVLWWRHYLSSQFAL